MKVFLGQSCVEHGPPSHSSSSPSHPPSLSQSYPGLKILQFGRARRACSVLRCSERLSGSSSQCLTLGSVIRFRCACREHFAQDPEHQLCPVVHTRLSWISSGQHQLCRMPHKFPSGRTSRQRPAASCAVSAPVVDLISPAPFVSQKHVEAHGGPHGELGRRHGEPPTSGAATRRAASC